MGILQTRNLIVQQFDALRQRRGKSILLNADNAFDIVLLCKKLAEILCIAENLNDCIHGSIKEGLCYPQHTSMTDCAAKCAAQNVSTTFIRW